MAENGFPELKGREVTMKQGVSGRTGLKRSIAIYPCFNLRTWYVWLGNHSPQACARGHGSTLAA